MIYEIICVDGFLCISHLDIVKILFGYLHVRSHLNMQITCEQYLDATCRENHQHRLSRKSFI